uniref:Uncharacterized protein n=1 Tax=Arundo donax TaxID=35708 RepID=A0A0A9F2G3_ARUDO
MSKRITPDLGSATMMPLTGSHTKSSSCESPSTPRSAP